MAQYTDLERFLNDDDFRTPPLKSRAHPEGRVYVVPSPDAETGLWLTALANIGIQVNSTQAADIPASELAKLNLNDDDERDFYQRVLGSAYDEMVADGVSWVVLQRLGSYAFTYFAMSPDVADQAIREGAFGGKPAPKAPQDRKPRSTAAKSRRSPASAASKSRTAKATGA